MLKRQICSNEVSLPQNRKKHSSLNRSKSLLNHRLCETHFLKCNSTCPTGISNSPGKFCRAHIPKIENSLQFLETTVYSTGGKQFACHLLEQQKRNNYSKYIDTHTLCYIYTYVLPISQPAKISNRRRFKR